MKKELTLIEITDEKPMQEWAAKLMGERNKEARTTLAAEGVTLESCFSLEIDGKKYLGFYMEGDQIVPGDPSVPVNKEHTAVLHSIRVCRIKGTLLYSLLPTIGES